MTERLPENMRRELALAVSAAKADGQHYALLTPQQKAHYHSIAKMCLGGANKLIIDAVVEARTYERQAAHDQALTYRRRIYEDAYADGEKGEYHHPEDSELALHQTRYPFGLGRASA